MKAAINTCTWSAYAAALGTPFSLSYFLREAAEAGYEGVEFGGSAETLGPAKECLALVKSFGLEIAAFASGITYNEWQPNTDEYRRDIDYAAALGVPTLMVCGGFMPSPRRNTYDFDYDIFAANLAKMMQYASERGLTVAYHPHRGSIVETTHEAQEMVARIPDLRFCPDFAHLEASGDDALAFIGSFADRCVYAHVKDFHWAKNEFTELGEGDSKLVVSDCIAALRSCGYAGWLCVELDKKFALPIERTPLESAKIGRQYLRDKCGV